MSITTALSRGWLSKKADPVSQKLQKKKKRKVSWVLLDPGRGQDLQVPRLEATRGFQTLNDLISSCFHVGKEAGKLACFSQFACAIVGLIFPEWINGYRHWWGRIGEWVGTAASLWLVLRANDFRGAAASITLKLNHK